MHHWSKHHDTATRPFDCTIHTKECRVALQNTTHVGVSQCKPFSYSSMSIFFFFLFDKLTENKEKTAVDTQTQILLR